MKIIKSFDSFLNEKVSQKEIDRILDKINSDGVKSLTDEERKTLSNIDNPSFESKDDIINHIKEIVENNDGFISIWDIIYDVDVQNGITYKTQDSRKDIIEAFTDYGVMVVSYQGEEGLGEYDVEYEEVDISILKEIKILLDTSIKNGLL